MNSIGLTGEDVIVIDGSQILADFADQDYGKLEFPNDLTTVKASKNGNVMIGENASGNLAELSLRLIVGGTDDKYLNSRLIEQKSDIAGFIALTATITKRAGDGTGNVSSVVYTCVSGSFKKMPGMVSNSEGSTDQAVVIYTMTFGQAPRTIQ